MVILIFCWWQKHGFTPVVTRLTSQRWPPVATSSIRSHASAAGVAALQSCSSPLCLTPFPCILYRSTRSSRWNCGYQMIAHQSRWFVYIVPLPASKTNCQTKCSLKNSQRWFLNTVTHAEISRLLVILTFILKTLPMAMLTSWRLCWTTTTWFSSWTCQRTSEAMSWTGS